MTEFNYNVNAFHKAVFFGPGNGDGKNRPKTALCKMYHKPDGCYQIIDEEICKRNWKKVTCEVCRDLAGK